MNQRSILTLRFSDFAIILSILILAVVGFNQIATGSEPTPAPVPNEGSTMLQVAEDIGIDLEKYVPVCELYATTDEAALMLERRNSLENQPRVSNPSAVQTSDIQIIFDNSQGVWTNEARNALTYSAGIWEGLLVSNVPITVRAYYSSNLGSNVLGGAYSQFLQVSGGRFYATALLNSINGVDGVPGEEDIIVIISSNASWYYGTDANPPNGQYDLVSVMLHEIGHGLGFFGGMDVNNGIGTYGAFPVIYDSFTENGNGTPLLTYPKNSSTLGTQLTSNNVFFDGSITRSVNGNSPAELYAPSIWNDGSSYSHLAQSFNGTDSSLMTFSIGTGTAEHDPGPVALAILSDIGWNIPSLTKPQIENRALMLVAGNGQNNAVDLWAITSDNTADSGLTFGISNNSGNNINVTLDSNRYLDVTTSGTGSLVVNVSVTDPDSNVSNATFTVYSVNSINNLSFPFISREP